MSDQIARANKEARERARTAGRATYRHEVVDSWPACVECGTTIRHRGAVDDRFRRCGCVDVRWYCAMDGWRRESE